MALKLFVWSMIVLWVMADAYPDVNLYARGWYWTSRYWYGLARFAGNAGLSAEKHYYEEMDSVNG